MHEPATGDTTVDGLSFAYLAIETVRSSIKVNGFVKIKKLKKIKPANLNFNIVQWHLAMELKRAEIELRSPGSYYADHFVLDIFNGALECKCKTFLSQLQAMKQKWLISNPNTAS